MSTDELYLCAILAKRLRLPQRMRCRLDSDLPSICTGHLYPAVGSSVAIGLSTYTLVLIYCIFGLGVFFFRHIALAKSGSFVIIGVLGFCLFFWFGGWWGGVGWETCNCYTLAFVFLTAAIFETEVGERGWPIVAGNTSLGDRMGS